MGLDNSTNTTPPRYADETDEQYVAKIERRIVEWLRDLPAFHWGYSPEVYATELANAIERGEHR